MAGPMGGGGGPQNALLQMIRQKQMGSHAGAQAQIGDPGALGGIGAGAPQEGGNLMTQMGQGVGGAAPGVGALMQGLGAAGHWASDQALAPVNAMTDLGRSVKGLGPRLANTIQGGPGAGIQNALMQAMNKPGIGSPESPAQEKAEGPTGPSEESGEQHAPDVGLPTSLASPMGQAMLGRQVAPDASLGSPMGLAMRGQGVNPGTPAPGVPFRSEELAAEQRAKIPGMPAPGGNTTPPTQQDTNPLRRKTGRPGPLPI